jgi:hypothetical protein
MAKSPVYTWSVLVICCILTAFKVVMAFFDHIGSSLTYPISKETREVLRDK